MHEELGFRKPSDEVKRIRERGDFKVEETTDVDEGDDDILSTMLTMAEAKAAVFTIKGRDRAVRAALERSASRVRS